MNLVANLTSSELKYKIALGTPIPELGRLCGQSRDWSEVCNSEEFWRLRFQQDFSDRWLLKGKNYKESYQFWYHAKIKARPFGYYPDDQSVLNSLERYQYGGPERRIYALYELNANISSTHAEQIIRHILFHVDDMMKESIPVLDVIVVNNIDQIEFLTKFFKKTYFDRLDVTISEAFDLFCYIINRGIYNKDSYIGNKLAERGPILSSLNSIQLREFLGSSYDGFPDHASMLYTAVDGQCLTQLTVLKHDPGTQGFETEVGPSDFNLERYQYIKRFELIKIIWLFRSYLGKVAPFGSAPPYLYVSFCQPNVILEKLYIRINQDNYISILKEMRIRTDDNPNYYQAFGRLTMIDGFAWLKYDDFSFLASSLGLPQNIIEELRRVFVGDEGDFIDEAYIGVVEAYLKV